MSWRSHVALLLLAGGASGALRAAEAPVDADLLEFLGSIDSEDSGWNEYLEKTDIRKVAKPSDPAARPPADQGKPLDQNVRTDNPDQVKGK